MKKLLLIGLALLTLGWSVNAQQIRTNYRSGGITHISTGYEPITLGDIPSEVRVELAGFPDGSTLYLLYINLFQKNATNVPKGVKMGITLTSGKLVRLEQIGEDSATKRRLDGGNFINRLKYAVEAADMEKMVRGIKSLDIITGWNPDDYIQASFPGDELSALLKRQCEAILEASKATIDLQATLAGFTENLNSTLTTSNPVVGRGNKYDYNIILSHLYYKNNNEEDIDLAFVIGTNERKFQIPYDSSVRFTLKDGSVVGLLQTRNEENFVYVYPTMEDLFRLADVGIASLSVDCEGAVLEDTFEGKEEDFTAAIRQQLYLLLSMSKR